MNFEIEYIETHKVECKDLEYYIHLLSEVKSKIDSSAIPSI